MATLTPVVRNPRKDGCYPVYIRISQNSQPAYIRTGKHVAPSEVSSRGEIKDVYVNRFCYELIEKFYAALNRVDYSRWTANEIRDFLSKIDDGVSFSDFCKGFISRKSELSENNARMYRVALDNFAKYVGREVIHFSDLSEPVISSWIRSMEAKKRARSLYPNCLKTMYVEAMKFANDPRSGVKIPQGNPWLLVDIPRYASKVKKAITIDQCRAFFDFKVPESGTWSKRMRLGQDVAMMCLCLAGINTVDLFKLRKRDFYGGIIHYCRSKTSSRRADEAYFEIRVPEVLNDVMERNLADEESEMLFSFSERYADAKTFNVTVNVGIHKICSEIKSEIYSGYTFRHTWATIARNDVGASLSDVGFAMNHFSHGVTRGYIKPDFSPVWVLNEEVVSLVFPKAKITPQNACEGDLVNTHDMIYARAYFHGECVGELSNIGFESAENVIRQLAMRLPDKIQSGATVQFRIKNVDSGEERVLERRKGVDF